MACWQLLNLAGGEHVPQLLVKPCFHAQSYSVFVTDLGTVWSEELGLDGIIQRASEEESPIEVRRHDASQLDILLHHVRTSLERGDDASCRITRSDNGGIVLHTTVKLPGPLGSLRWTFPLAREPSATLKNELVLPLLVSLHRQHGRINHLLAAIHEKDRAISKLVDQFEGSNLDLASAFPSLGGTKPGRRVTTRDHAARQITALRPFEEDSWRRDTDTVRHGNISTLQLFQDALSECTPTTSSDMMPGKSEDSWWTLIAADLSSQEILQEARGNLPNSPDKHSSLKSDDETETEDEFETHENFKLREAATRRARTRPPVSPTEAKTNSSEGETATEDDDEDDDADLDIPQHQHGQKQAQARGRSDQLKPGIRETSIEEANQSPLRKAKGFRIGGNIPKISESSPPSSHCTKVNINEAISEDALSETLPDSKSTSPKNKRSFKIGGKNSTPTVPEQKAKASLHMPQRGIRRPERENTATTEDAKTDLSGKAPKTRLSEEKLEETPEGRAERKRLELKRKNEELAKKQTQRKRKRF